MNSKKIAGIIFLISLILLSLGLVVYLVRQRGDSKNLQTKKLSVPPVVNNQGSSGDTTSTGLVTPDNKPITEEQITAKIEAKKVEIRQEAKGRPYTSEELLFIDSPRQAVINELKSGQ